jgi:hypothetical protein
MPSDGLTLALMALTEIFDVGYWKQASTGSCWRSSLRLSMLGGEYATAYSLALWLA